MKKRSRLYFTRVVAVAFLACGLSSCGNELEFFDVYGTVTLNGSPVEYAEMHIHPNSENPNGGRTMHVRIINGEYDTRPIGVAGGPAEWKIAAVAPGTIRVDDAEEIGPEVDELFLQARKQVFTKAIEIDRDEINLELP